MPAAPSIVSASCRCASLTDSLAYNAVAPHRINAGVLGMHLTISAVPPSQRAISFVVIPAAMETYIGVPAFSDAASCLHTPCIIWGLTDSTTTSCCRVSRFDAVVAMPNCLDKNERRSASVGSRSMRRSTCLRDSSRTRQSPAPTRKSLPHPPHCRTRCCRPTAPLGRPGFSPTRTPPRPGGNRSCFLRQHPASLRRCS